MEGTEYSNFNKDYSKTGKALLHANDIKTSFVSGTVLDYEPDKYIYSYKLSEEQLKQNKEFDFMIEMNEKDNIKIDITNTHSDFQWDTRECIDKISFFDENKNLIKEINNKDLVDIHDKNIIDVLEKDKKYLIRAKLKRPCNINFIRENNSNKIHSLGEKKDDNFEYLKEHYEYTEEEEKMNNYKHGEGIKDTLEIARLMENFMKFPCYRKVKKISSKEVVLEGNSFLTDKILYKINHDVKNKKKKKKNMISNKEVIKFQDGKIKFFNMDMTQFFNKIFDNQEMLIDENKIGIIDNENKKHFLDIKDLKKFNGTITKYFVPTATMQKDIFGQEEFSIKNTIFNSKDEAIKKQQEISKNNAGLIKDFMTGGVEFENPKIFRNFIQNFYTFKEHIIAFKCEENSINDIKNTLKRIVNNDIIINLIQEVWETILDELIDGYLIGGSLPFISLHFNENALLYSVMNINYKHTIVGHVLTFIDFFLKGFTNGAYFDEKFVYDWYNNNSHNFSNSIDDCNSSLLPHANNLFKYIYENKIDFTYCTTDGIYEDMLLNGKEQYYLSSNRIIGKMDDAKILHFDDNILYPEFNFKVEGDLDPLPTLIQLLNEQSENYLKWEKTKRAHEIMKQIIKLEMNRLPFLKGYFYLLDMITFAIYYLASIKSLSSFPDTSHSIKKRCLEQQKFYMKVIPSVFPPLPTTNYIRKEFTITFKELVDKMDQKMINETNSNIYRILDNNLNEYFNDDLKTRIIKEIEKRIIDECYNRYRYELSINNKDSLKYSIKFLDIICEDLYKYWNLLIDSYKNEINELTGKIKSLSQIYLNYKKKLDSLNTQMSLYNKLITIKDPINEIFEKEKNLYVKFISQKRGLNYNYFTIEQIESIAKNLNDEELTNQIEKYKVINSINYQINQLIKVFVDNYFYEYLQFNKPYKRNITLISVGYHKGSNSYRGGCLVNFNEEIKLEEKKDNYKKKIIKDALNENKEEIKIEEQLYFLVKTKMNSLLNDKDSLIEINHSKNKNQQNIIKNISNYNPSNNLQNENGLSLNFYKLLSNNEKIINTINENDLLKEDESKENLLTYVPAINNSKLIKNLINRQIRINNVPIGNNKITPLLSAISIKNLEIAEILINKELNVNDSTDIKFTPLHFASYYNLPKIVQLLLKKNANTSIKTKKEGEIPLHLACRKGNFEIVEILLKNRFRDNIINQRKSDNKISLHLASITSSLCTQILLKYNVSKYLKDNNGYEPSKLALIYGREDIFEMIGTNDNSILEYYKKSLKFDKCQNDDKKDNIKKLCRFMRKNDLEKALKISDLINNSKDIKDIINNKKKIQEKIIRNACKGVSIDYLYILFKLFNLKNKKSLIFRYIYKYGLNTWITELEKNKICFDKTISDENWDILQFLLKNNVEEFINLMNVLEEIPNKYLSKILFIKCINKISIKNFENLFIKFKSNNLNIEQFSETSETNVDDITYLMNNKYNFNINFSTFNLDKMINYCRPSVVQLIITNTKYLDISDTININYLIKKANEYKRFDILQILDVNNNKFFSEKMTELLLILTDKIKIPLVNYDNKRYNFCLYEFKNNLNIFDLIIEIRKYKDLEKINNFPLYLINKDILFNNFKNLKIGIIDLPLKDIFLSYLNFIFKIINNNDHKSNYSFDYSYFIELIDIIVSKQKNTLKFDSLFSMTINSLKEIFDENDYNLSFLNLSKNSLNQNIMHIISKNEVFISSESQVQIMDLLKKIKNDTMNNNLFKKLFNDKDNNSLTFLMYLNHFEQNELFVQIYLEYKQYINPFIFNQEYNNILHLIILQLKDDSTKKGCMDKYMLIIQDIIFNNPNIIFTKNIRDQTPLSLIFGNENNITGPINIIFKVFSYETLEKKSEDILLNLTLVKNNIFILRYLIEYCHININRFLKNGVLYPLNLAAFLSKIDLFEILIQYGANPFLKNGENLDTINYAMKFGNLSFLEHIYNMKICDICFNNQYLFDLATNQTGFEIFKKVIKNKNIDLNIVNSKKETLLMRACKSDNYELINLLINYGINPLLKDLYNNTALHYCCINNSINSINILLQKLYLKSISLLKNNISSININDDTPLHVASKMGNIEIVQKLLVYHLIIDNNNKNIRTKSKGEFLPIHYAIINDKIESALFLLKALNITDEEIENIEKDSFYNKIKDFISLKNQYIETYKNKIDNYIEKLNNDIYDLQLNCNFKKSIYNINEINNFNDIYEFNLEKKNSYKILLNKISKNNKVIINEEDKNKLLKYFNYINKEKMINKIIELNEKGLEKYIFNFLDILDKSNWVEYEKLDRIVHLFTSNIIPYLEDNYLKECIEIIDMIINKDILKDKKAFNFLSWIETIIISISEDISQFDINEIITLIKEFYDIILIKLKNGNVNGLEILSYPYSNIKFYYFIKQLILLLKNKSEELCIIQLKNINYCPSIMLEGNNDQYSIFHYSRIFQNNELYKSINNILKNSSISPKIIDIYLSIFNTLLNKVDYYDISENIKCSLYKYKLKILQTLDIVINSNKYNIEKIVLILKYIENNLIEFGNKIYDTNLDDFKMNLINNIEQILNKEEKNISINLEDICVKNKEGAITNNKEIEQLKEILKKFKESQKRLKFYNFKYDGKRISKIFFSNPNINNLIDLVNIIVEGFKSVNINIDINQILVFSNFILYYINKNNIKLKGRIGEYYFENRSLILAMLALAHSLNDKNVDIIAPSKYLSEKYYEKYKKVYDLFEIKSNSLFSKINEYDQIIYGTLREFQLNNILETFDLNNNFDATYFNKIRNKDIILFEEINEMVNLNSFTTSYAYSNNFVENYNWVYKPIYNLIKDNCGLILNLGFIIINIPNNDIRNALKQVNNGQYKEIVDSIPNELIDEWKNSSKEALLRQKDIDYKKELKDGMYQISLINKETGNVEENLKYSKYLHPFIEIKETIIPNNLVYLLSSISKLVYINYCYQNIFCIGGKIDDTNILNLFNLDNFECLSNYKIPNFEEIIFQDKDSKFNAIKNNIIENMKNEDCNLLVLFLNYFEANNFSEYLNDNKINHEFIYGTMNEEKEKKITKFENEKSLLVSTYDSLKGINFNFSIAINKLYVIIGFKTTYYEKVYNSIAKGKSFINSNNNTNRTIEVSGIIINNGKNEESLLDNIDIKNKINEHKKKLEIALYQNILIRLLKSNECKNIIDTFFMDISSTSSFIVDSVNFFRFKWCDYYDKNKEINVYQFLNSINLNDLLFYINDFETSIRKDILNINIINNLLLQLKRICPQYYLNNDIILIEPSLNDVDDKEVQNHENNDFRRNNNKINNKRRERDSHCRTCCMIM